MESTTQKCERLLLVVAVKWDEKVIAENLPRHDHPGPVRVYEGPFIEKFGGNLMGVHDYGVLAT